MRRCGEETPGFTVTAEQHMLTVVHKFAGLAVDERGRTAAEPGPRFEYEHARAVARQPYSGTEPGEAGAHHHRVEPGHGWNSHWRSAITACSGFGTRTRSAK